MASAAVARSLVMRRAIIPSRPPPNKIATAFSPKKKAANARAPRAANPKSLTAVFPNRQMAIAITASTAGLIPAKIAAACGRLPKRT